MRESNKELISLNGKMKIYFAGSIRGGRKDAELYRKIIAALKEKHQVLTEHVGDLRLSTVEDKGDRIRNG